MSSPVGAVQALTARTAAEAAVVGGDAASRETVERLLGEAGFALRDHARPDALTVLLGLTRDDRRLGAIRELSEARPGGWILAVLPAGLSNAALRRVLLAGATGIVIEDDVERALVPTARAMLAGQLAVPSALGRQIAPRPLSHREKQILALVMLGLTNREIADKLFLAESTVKTHLSSAFRKIDARSRSEAVARIQDPEAGYGEGILALADSAA